MKYRHLTEGERYQIQALYAEGLGPTEIGERIGHCKSVISRELKRKRRQGCDSASEAQRSYR